MRRGEGYDGAAFHEAVGSRVRWDGIGDRFQDAALQVLEKPLRAFDETDASAALRFDAVAVVLELGVWVLGAEVLAVREPIELGGVQAEPAGEVAF